MKTLSVVTLSYILSSTSFIIEHKKFTMSIFTSVYNHHFPKFALYQNGVTMTVVHCNLKKKNTKIFHTTPKNLIVCQGRYPHMSNNMPLMSEDNDNLALKIAHRENN